MIRLTKVILLRFSPFAGREAVRVPACGQNPTPYQRALPTSTERHLAAGSHHRAATRPAFVTLLACARRSRPVDRRGHAAPPTGGEPPAMG